MVVERGEELKKCLADAVAVCVYVRERESGDGKGGGVYECACAERYVAAAI